MRFSHRVVEARWSGATWTVTVEDMLTGRTMAQEADVLITAIGVLNRWEWPHIPGLMDFEGKMMHSAKWDEEYDMQVGQDSHRHLRRMPLIHLVGQDMCRHRRRLQWHTNRT